MTTLGVIGLVLLGVAVAVVLILAAGADAERQMLHDLEAEREFRELRDALADRDQPRLRAINGGKR